MIGLVYKDLCNLKRYIKQLLLIVAAFTVIFALQDGANIGFLCSYTLVLCVMVVISSISYDDFAKWDKYALTMPISRNVLIGSKYLLGILAIVAGNILSLILFFCVKAFFGGNEALNEALLTMLIMTGLGFMMLGIMLPLLVKFGAEKARMMVMLVALVPTALVLILSRMGFSAPSEAFLENLIWLIPSLGVLAFVISFFISVGIAKKKEY